MLKGHHRSASAAGFTLVEMLVVIFIISVLVGVATLSFGAIGQREFRSEADRLRLVLQHCSDSALFQQRTLGLFIQQSEEKESIDKKGSYWVGEHLQGSWHKAENTLFQQHILPDGISLTFTKPVIEPFGNAKQKKGEETLPTPLLLFYGGGEYTPFHIALQQADRTPWALAGDGLGKVTLELADAQ